MRHNESPELIDDAPEATPEVVSPQDFGGMLRQARERHGISLRHIAVTTKISVSALEALERNDVSRLPGGIFSRAFVRSYASEVGLDPERVVKEFIERFPTQDAGHSTRHTREFQEAEDLENRRRVAGTAIKLVGASIPLVAAILYFTLGGSTPTPAETAGAEPAVVAEATTDEGAGRASDDEAANTPDADAPAAGSATAAETPAAIPGILRVVIRATGPCWVSVVTDGRQSFARVLNAGEEVFEEVRDELVMQIGDAGSFSYSINNAAGRSLGSPGEVVTARITAANYETFLAR